MKTAEYGTVKENFYCDCRHHSLLHEETLLGTVCHGTVVQDDALPKPCGCESLREDLSRSSEPEWISGRRG